MRNRKALEKALAVTMLASSLIPSLAYADGEAVDLGTRDNPKKVEQAENKDKKETKKDNVDGGLGKRETPVSTSVEDKTETPAKSEEKPKKEVKKDKPKKKPKKEEPEVIEEPEPIEEIDMTSGKKSNEYNELAGGNTDDVNWDSFNFGYDMTVKPSRPSANEFTSYDPNIPVTTPNGSHGTGNDIINANDFNVDITNGSVMSNVDDNHEVAEMPSLFDSLKLIKQEGQGNEAEMQQKKETVKFNLNPNADNAKLYDLGVPADTTDKALVAETLSQASILNGGRFVEDKDNILLYKGDKIKVFPRTTPLKELIAFFDDDKFVVEKDASRVGGKFTIADYIEVMGKLNIKVNGKDLVLTTNPQVVDGIVLIPIRDVAVALGAKVEWNQQTKVAKITKGNTVVLLNDKNEIARQNGVGYRLSASPEVTPEKRMLASISILVKNMDATMSWDAHNNSLTIETKEYTKEKEKQENNANAKADEERDDASMQGTKFKKPRDLSATPVEDKKDTDDTKKTDKKENKINTKTSDKAGTVKKETKKEKKPEKKSIFNMFKKK